MTAVCGKCQSELVEMCDEKQDLYCSLYHGNCPYKIIPKGQKYYGCPNRPNCYYGLCQYCHFNTDDNGRISGPDDDAEDAKIKGYENNQPFVNKYICKDGSNIKINGIFNETITDLRTDATFSSDEQHRSITIETSDVYVLFFSSLSNWKVWKRVFERIIR